jgi:hypothetical protein
MADQVNEKCKPIWMVWEVKPGSYPALRAICSSEKIAKLKKLTVERGTSSLTTVSIEKNLTNHLYGQVDYDVAAIMINSHRRPHEGD